MNDEQMQPILDTFYRDREIPRPKVQTGVASVMTQVPRTRQHSRRWPFPVFYRKTETPTATDTTDYLPTSIPASNGHSPTVLGRTQSMLSPVKAITAGALVFAIGGAFLIAQPFDQQGASVPGAESGVAMTPAWVTGTVTLATWCSSPGEAVGTEGLVRRERGYRCEGQVWEASDVRLAGEAVSTWDADVYDVEDRYGPVSVRVGGYEVRNGSGGWSCRHSGVAQGAGLQVKPASGETLVCVGDGGYDGLAAVLELDWTSRPVTFQGVIFPGSLPSSPSE